MPIQAVIVIPLRFLRVLGTNRGNLSKWRYSSPSKEGHAKPGRKEDKEVMGSNAGAGKRFFLVKPPLKCTSTIILQ